MTKPTFDMEAALQALRDGKDLNGKDGILTPLIKQLTEAAMQAELEQHLAGDESPNRKNGSSRKTMKCTSGDNCASVFWSCPFVQEYQRFSAC
jgi:putative transposase